MAVAETAQRVSSVVVYSNDAGVREAVMFAVGRRPAPDVGSVRYREVDNQDELIEIMDAGGVDLLIVDGEAQPTGGMGLARQLKFELADCPPICLLIARRDDRWLATWSLADAVLTLPPDPIGSADTVAEVLRSRAPHAAAAEGTAR